MAVAPLTISYPREQDIDLTKPYLDLGMQFIMKVGLHWYLTRPYLNLVMKLKYALIIYHLNLVVWQQ